MKFLHLALLLTTSFAQNQEPNVCKSWSGYFNKKSAKDCYFDNRAEESDAPSLITKNGYHFESYDFETADGYILSLFRIPGKGIPVLLVHSSDFSSSSFLALKNDSLAFVLANENYDVFLLNLRGSRYSESHKTLSSAESAFWDYTFDHLAQYDLPTAFRVIERLSKSRKMLFVGHNSGASIFLAHGAQFPEEVKDRVIAAALIAPLVEMKSSSRNNLVTELISGVSNYLWKHLQNLGLDRLLSKYHYQRIFIRTIRCFPFLLQALLNQKIAPDIAPYYLNSIKGAGSTKLQLHLDQIIAKNSFQAYDYGELENINKYGFKQPPKYSYTAIEAPIFVIHAANDRFVNSTDIETFYSKLNENAKTLGKLMVVEDGFDENGYLFGVNAKELLYDVVLEKFARAVVESPGSISEGLLEGS